MGGFKSPWKNLIPQLNWEFCRTGGGLLKLRDDVQTCGYEDVRVMWEMLRRSESEVVDHPPKRKQRPFWRVFVWSNHATTTATTTPTSSLSPKHA